MGEGEIVMAKRNETAVKRARLRNANREKFKNVRPGPSKVVESGVGNIPMTVARATLAAAKRLKGAPATGIKPVKPSTSGVKASSAQLKAMANAARAKAAKAGAEGPKRPVISKGKKIGYGSVAAAGAVGAAATNLSVSVKRNPPPKSRLSSGPSRGDTKVLGGRKAVFNGTNWVPVKKK